MTPRIFDTVGGIMQGVCGTQTVAMKNAKLRKPFGKNIPERHFYIKTLPTCDCIRFQLNSVRFSGQEQIEYCIYETSPSCDRIRV